jgi:dihydroorotate dehydrogenase electron transfer subunit
MPINHRALSIEGKILTNRKVGAYHQISIEAGAIGSRAKPGNFISLSLGGANSSMVLSRVFAIYRKRSTSADQSIIELIISPVGIGSVWLAEAGEGTTLRITGPLGTAFPIPADPINVAIVGGGYGSAPLFDLAEALKAKSCRVDAIIGASTAAKIFAPLEGKRTVNSVTVTTSDGSAGITGLVTDPLEELIIRQNIELIYSCGPMAMLRAVNKVATKYGIAHQISVEESMACGIGVCMTCVLPMKDSLGEKMMGRACIEGPVLDAEKIIWEAE